MSPDKVSIMEEFGEVSFVWFASFPIHPANAFGVGILEQVGEAGETD